MKVSGRRGTQSGKKGCRWSMLARIIKGSKWMAWRQPHLTDDMCACDKHCLHPSQGGGGNFLCESGWKKGGLTHAGEKGFGRGRGWDNRMARGQCKHTHSIPQWPTQWQLPSV